VSEEHAEGTAPAPASAADEQPPVVEDEVAALTKERDDYLDALQRLKAEFDNYRKRVARDQQELAARAHERLEGVRLVHRSLADALAKEGLAEIETGGTFDPHTQEALLSQPSEAEEGSVIQVLQKGYSLGDRVLRPARVVISSGPGADG
jgi:molecular chaperone GrpE